MKDKITQSNQSERSNQSVTKKIIKKIMDTMTLIEHTIALNLYEIYSNGVFKKKLRKQTKFGLAFLSVAGYAVLFFHFFIAAAITAVGPAIFFPSVMLMAILFTVGLINLMLAYAKGGFLEDKNNDMLGPKIDRKDMNYDYDNYDNNNDILLESKPELKSKQKSEPELKSPKQKQKQEPKPSLFYRFFYFISVKKNNSDIQMDELSGNVKEIKKNN